MIAPTAELLIRNIGELVTCAGPAPRCGSAQSMVGSISGAAVAVREQRIVALGRESDVLSAVTIGSETVTLDAHGGLVTPGFVDAHTHPIFAGYREAEFNRILAGETYEDIAHAGGGIRSTVSSTRAAGGSELFHLANQRLTQMLRHGTTTAEAKSGYGLDLEAETRSLECIASLTQRHPVELIATNLAAHAVPREYEGRRGAYVDRVIGEILPGTAHLSRFCDVFCDPTAFTPAESERILRAGRDLGLGARIHADEFSDSGGARVAAEVGAVSADHLGGISQVNIELLRDSGTTAVLLPGTLFFLGKTTYAPARALIREGVPVALGTDLNPGSSHTESMQIVIQLACLMMRMTVEEALVAATLNAAYSLQISDRVGSLEVGKQADLVIFAVPNRFHLVYHYGINHVRCVVKRGAVVVGADLVS